MNVNKLKLWKIHPLPLGVLHKESGVSDPYRFAAVPLNKGDKQPE
jgi:hypothetical protein